MAEFPKYSVLMSLYDKEEPSFLKVSINSMLNQTVSPDQIVVVKDGPINTRLEQVLNGYITGYPDIFTIVSIEKNMGLANALNEGLKLCRNDLVARMDTDDISIPERCEKELTLFFNEHKLSIVGSNVDEFIDNPDNVVSRRIVPTSEEQIMKFSKRRNPFNHPSVMYRKSAIQAAGGYNIERRRAQDFELFVTMLNEGYCARNINESLVKFRANDSSYGRKKSWSHCKTYIDIVHGFWKKGYSSFLDYVVVLLGQTIMCVLPANITNTMFKKLLRK